MANYLNQNKIESPKPLCITVVSGGKNSIALANYLAREGYDQILVSFNYNQDSVDGLVEARHTAMKLGCPHRIINLLLIGMEMTGSPLVDPSIEVTKEAYDLAVQTPTIIPGVMSIMLSIAYSIGLQTKADKIAVGSNSSRLGHDGLNYISGMNKALAGPKKTGLLTPGLFIDVPFAYLGDTDIAILDL
jgi:7-cyano-7-deazaguanine synthase in queuosine biosynthesis